MGEGPPSCVPCMEEIIPTFIENSCSHFVGSESPRPPVSMLRRIMSGHPQPTGPQNTTHTSTLIRGVGGDKQELFPPSTVTSIAIAIKNRHHPPRIRPLSFQLVSLPYLIKHWLKRPPTPTNTQATRFTTGSFRIFHSVLRKPFVLP